MSDLPGTFLTALEAFVQRPRILLGVDFDGVISPFVTDPLEARPAPGALTSLYAAADLPDVSVAVVSGRDLKTLRALTGIPEGSPIVLIGSHGAQSSLHDLRDGDDVGDPDQSKDLESPDDLEGTDDLEGAARLDDDATARLAAARADLEEVALAHPGTRIELKRGAVALHTRGVDPTVGAAALASALELSHRHYRVHVIPGKEVVELTVVQTDKGVALRALAAARAIDATAYFGDDVTDEWAFAALDTASGDVTVKVGDGDTLAAHRLGSVEDVVGALAVLVVLRQSASLD